MSEPIKLAFAPAAQPLELQLTRRPSNQAELVPVLVGQPGPPGGATLITVGAAPLSGHTAVALDAAGQLVGAECTDPAHLGAVLGVIANAYSPGQSALVLTEFDLAHSGWLFTPGPVFVGAGGALVQALPVDALFVQVIGYALSATRIRIDVQPPIALP